MKVLRALVVTIVLSSLGSASSADVLSVVGESVVLAEDGSDVAKVALRFDVSSARVGEGRVVQSAYVEWEIAAMAGDRGTTFDAFRLQEAWGRLGPDARDVATALEAGAEAAMAVYPQDHARVGKRLLRLDVTHLAQEVLDENRSIVSLLLTTPNVPRQAFVQGLPNVHLTIRYGFLGSVAPLFRSRR
jgi:hypothetical protein